MCRTHLCRSLSVFPVVVCRPTPLPPFFFFPYETHLSNFGQIYGERLELISVWKHFSSNQFCLICSVLEKKETALFSWTQWPNKACRFWEAGSLFSYLMKSVPQDLLHFSAQVRFVTAFSVQCLLQWCIQSCTWWGYGKIMLLSACLVPLSKVNILGWSFVLYPLRKLFLTLIFWLRIKWHRYTSKCEKKA